MRELPPLPATDLLIAGRVIPIMPRLVQIVGLNEAIVLQQLRFLLDDERGPLVRDGRRWAAGSYADWRERHFPFWHADTVERAFRSLERQGAIVSAAHNANRRDHSKWYSVEFDRLLEWERVCRASLNAAPLPRDPFRPRHPGGEPGDGRHAPPLPATELLLDEHPLLLLPGLAALVGFDEAIVLQQVRYWLADSRRPLIRDGRRWARFNQDGWHAQLSFRSKATVARAFRRLEALGLLISSSRYNAEPGDRTKAYTVDFDRLASLRDGGAGRAVPDGGAEVVDDREQHRAGTGGTARSRVATTGGDPTGRAEPIVQNAPDHDSNLRRPRKQSAATGGAGISEPPCHSAPIEGNGLRRPVAQIAAADDSTLPRSLTDQDSTKIDPKIDGEQQQDAASGQTVAVVVAGPVRDGDVERLVERGVTRRVAERLVRDADEGAVGRQVATYDRLRASDPDDARLSPGRLRRMIEEDWVAPTDRRAPIGRAGWPTRGVSDDDGAAAAIEQRQRREEELAAERARREALGLRDADQALWARVVQEAPTLPPPFRDAYLYAPARDTPGAVIFRSSADRRRAQGPAHATSRSRVRARLAAATGRPDAQVGFFAYDELLAMMRDGGGAAGRDRAAADASRPGVD